MSLVTSVLALLNDVFGNLIAPINSALSAKYFLKVGLDLSSVPFDVTKATTPPGLTLSRLFAKK